MGYRGRRGIVLGLLRIPKRIPSIPIHRSKRIVGKFEGTYNRCISHLITYLAGSEAVWIEYLFYGEMG